MWLYLESRPELLADAETLLHVGPEYSLKRRLSHRDGLRYVAADLDSPLADERVDITALPYANDSVEAIICSHVLEHVGDDHSAMCQMLRVLRPGGWAIVMAPVDRARDATFEDPEATSPIERLRLFGQEDHLRIYGRDLADRLRSAGFSVEVERLVETLPPDTVQRMRLDMEGDDDIYMCWKPKEPHGQR